MVAQLIGTWASKARAFSGESSAATGLGPAKRTDLSVQVLAGGEPIAQLARRHNVSRKFIYQQAAKASQALDDAFAPSVPDNRVLFEVPVTKDWLRQFVLSQVLIGHSSFRGVLEILNAVFDYRDISIGAIHNMVREAVDAAGLINDAETLSGISVGAHDEIYQAGRPVLVGMDVRSTYCYLLSAEDHCDQTTWGVHLLDLRDRGLDLAYTIADGGKALRAGQRAAWGEVPCHGDVFHAERDLGKLASFLTHRAAGCTTTRRKIERKIDPTRAYNGGRGLCLRLTAARKEEAQAIELSDDVRALVEWMQNDILSLAGPDLATRRELYDFIVEELRLREPRCAHRIGPVRRMLQGHRENLLAFAGLLDERFADLAWQMQVPQALVHGVCQLKGMDRNHAAYWQREAQLRKELRRKFYAVEAAVGQILSETPRASSIVENLNSRLRNYFFLRRHIGHGYLDLLRFFLNHRCFLRSDRPERVGKSPAELLSGKTHPHWLELLGYQRFSQN